MIELAAQEFPDFDDTIIKLCRWPHHRHLHDRPGSRDKSSIGCDRL
ncbi:hypothetical protein [Streptomyces venezuelae]|nr:hypothetical protein [Streptomyces venezuelae]